MSELACQHRGKEKQPKVYDCDLHGMCSLEVEHPRVRLCALCQDRVTPDVPSQGLGDRVAQALSLVGITKDRIETWLGKPCGCQERQEKLNQLGFWAARVLQGKLDKASEFLTRIIEKGS